MKTKKQTIKDKLLNIFNSYKLIICISFIINIILLSFSYNLMTSNHEYTFNGSDDYVSIKDGLIVLNNDLNLIYGNNIEYINEVDYEILSLNIGYYTLDNNENFVKLLGSSYTFDESMKLSEIINNFTNFNLIEKSNNSTIFTDKSVKYLDNGLYFVLEAKDIENNDINCKINLNITKISKF